ncbi:uncharacterized protein B4U79_04036 [Dinothrombium tinctorium]|uniref:Uncharacterized protein n=1 Tax=Dinothrombium tinctorium TaxID=1965070 RepID=A0A3S5WGR2_9ACAR|nr:uncharacterized protein B4U79_04036 [Dinothrombium tinctorium]
MSEQIVEQKTTSDEFKIEMNKSVIGNNAHDERRNAGDDQKQWTKFDDDSNAECKHSDGNKNNAVLNVTTLPPVATLQPSQSFQILSNQPSSDDHKDDRSIRSRSLSPKHHVAILPPPPSIKRPSSLSLKTSHTTVNMESPNPPNVESPIITATVSNQLHNIPLKDMTNNVAATSSSSKSFKNGDIIVSLLPQNTHCAWTTPASFKPELVPEELMAPGLRLTVEDYVNAIQILVNDYRFKLYIIFYKRILVVWIALGFVVLLSLLFNGVKGMALFGGGVLWLIINALGIFLTMWIKLKLYHMLERSVARVNETFIKHNILLGVDDRGKVSCHKVNLTFVYFDVRYCIKYLNDMLENDKRLEESAAANQTLPPLNFSQNEIDASDIIITGSSPTRLSQKEKYGEKLLLRYSQRWVKGFVRSRIDLNVPIHGDASVESTAPLPPRHCQKSRCLCQYIEEHLRFKPLAKCSIKELFC